ncbi:MAG: DUF819 domain-containing protein [bacterium]|nr:DUF819 domain-containing protein [bacterium]
MESLIHPDDAWTIWAVMLGCVALSIHLEQTRMWAAKLTGPVLALVVAIALSNTRVLPLESPSYGLVWDYVVPLCIPLLLFRASIFKIVKTSGSMFAAFHVSALGTLLGAAIATAVFHTTLPHAGELAGIMTGSYIGGGVNFFALAATFRPPEELTSSLLVADNVIMAIVFLILVSLTRFAFFRNNYPMPDQEEVEREGNADTLQAASFWKAKEISLLDIAKAMGIAMAIAAGSAKLAEVVRATGAPELVRGILGNQFLIITAVCLVVATVFHEQLEKIAGAEEIGTYLIYIFFFTIGIPADLVMILTKAPVLFLFCVVIAGVNFLVTFGLGKLFRMKLEDLSIVVNATLGGPTSAVALAIAKGWKDLVLPGLLVGLWGYVIGTWLGVAVGNLGKMIFE